MRKAWVTYAKAQSDKKMDPRLDQFYLDLNAMTPDEWREELQTFFMERMRNSLVHSTATVRKNALASLTLDLGDAGMKNIRARHLPSAGSLEGRDITREAHVFGAIARLKKAHAPATSSVMTHVASSGGADRGKIEDFIERVERPTGLRIPAGFNENVANEVLAGAFNGGRRRKRRRKTKRRKTRRRRKKTRQKGGELHHIKGI